MVKQTAGHEQLGNFAPKFAELNDDVLFGEVWSREDKLSLRDRSLVTICVFMGKGLVDNSLKYHIPRKALWSGHDPRRSGSAASRPDSSASQNRSASRQILFPGKCGRYRGCERN